MTAPTWRRWLPYACAAGLIVAGAVLLRAPSRPEPPAVLAAPPIAPPPAPAPEIEQATGTAPRPAPSPSARPASPTTDAAEAASEPPPALPAKPMSLRGTICLDAGGRDDELATTTAVAKELKRLLELRGFGVVLAAESGAEPPAEAAKTGIANGTGAALYVRLHLGEGTGWAVHFPDRTLTRGGVAGPPPVVIAASSVAAEAIAGQLGQRLSAFVGGEGARPEMRLPAPERAAAEAGSLPSTVPLVFVRLIDPQDTADAAWLATDEGRWRMAEALSRGIEQYVVAAQELAGEAP